LTDDFSPDNSGTENMYVGFCWSSQKTGKCQKRFPDDFLKKRKGLERFPDDYPKKRKGTGKVAG